MPGRPGRSGRVNQDGTPGRFLPLEPSSSAPALDGTTDSNQRYCAWVAAEVSAGNMDPRTADSCIGAAKAEQGAIKVKHALNELEQLRGYVERMEAAVKNRTREEAADRYHNDAARGTATYGRVRIPDGDPH